MRLLSYNIHKGIGGRDRRYRLDRIIQVIERENPDLICLQEVNHLAARTRRDDQPMQFIEAFRPIAHQYQLNVRFRRGGGYGNLVLSRWPFEAKRQVSLRLKRRKPRGAQMAVVATPEGPFHLVHVHLGLSERERRWQVDHLLQHDYFLKARHLPTLIVGDYNDWRNSLAKGSLTREGFRQLTSPRARFRSFPAYLPMAAIDKAFVTDGLAIRQARIVRSRLARDASDHLPLVIDFHLDPPSPLAGSNGEVSRSASGHDHDG